MINFLAIHLRGAVARLSNARQLRNDFPFSSSSLNCDFCGALLFEPGPLARSKPLEYGHCRACSVLLSKAPMPDYSEQTLYAPSPRFLDENITHYQRLFSTRPALLEALHQTGVCSLIDLAGGTGLFPRMIAGALHQLKDIHIVEVGEYANDTELHAHLNERLGTRIPLYFVRENVFSFLANAEHLCPNRVLISCVHFIDHLRKPDDFVSMLAHYAQGREVYVLVYCHALDSYNGSDWYVINTGTRGEHQIIYSHRALKNLLGRYGRIIHGGVYHDDQYLLLKLAA